MHQSRECSHADNEICKKCLLKPSQEASRAGTAGFRSPEILMKHPNQTTAVDIWAAGAIFISLLSMRYPFFNAADDLTSLCQIITLLGSDMVINAGKCIGKQVTLSKDIIGYELGGRSRLVACSLKEKGRASLQSVYGIAGRSGPKKLVMFMSHNIHGSQYLDYVVCNRVKE